ncbi:hypothetical protein HBI80_075060 [Parastagonospora nodorum]|nr:hypothetical protein HBI80_075060 [Parastagonospora nodorum]
MPTSLAKLMISTHRPLRLTKIMTTTLYLNNIQHLYLTAELEARHSLLNLSVHDLVEEFARHRNYSLRPSCLIRL